MTAVVLSLAPDVREAALDVKALRRKIKQAGERAWEWFPAEANARERMVRLSRERSFETALSSGQTPPPRPGEGFLKLARTS
jgi:hypothetical protein